MQPDSAGGRKQVDDEIMSAKWRKKAIIAARRLANGLKASLTGISKVAISRSWLGRYGTYHDGMPEIKTGNH